MNAIKFWCKNCKKYVVEDLISLNCIVCSKCGEETLDFKKTKEFKKQIKRRQTMPKWLKIVIEIFREIIPFAGHLKSEIKLILANKDLSKWSKVGKITLEVIREIIPFIGHFIKYTKSIK